MSRADTVSAAFSNWADDHRNNAEICQRLSMQLKDYNVEADADTHRIRLHPLDEQTGILLEILAKEGLVDTEEWENEDELEL